MPRTLATLPPQDVVKEYVNYSGSQVIAYFYVPTPRGNQRIKVPITAISYNYQHSKRPIYGYSSIYFDAIAQGQVIVEGQFSINFSYNDPITSAINKSLNISPISEDEKDEIRESILDKSTDSQDSGKSNVTTYRDKPVRLGPDLSGSNFKVTTASGSNVNVSGGVIELDNSTLNISSKTLAVPPLVKVGSTHRIDIVVLNGTTGVSSIISEVDLESTNYIPDVPEGYYKLSEVFIYNTGRISPTDSRQESSNPIGEIKHPKTETSIVPNTNPDPELPHTKTEIPKSSEIIGAYSKVSNPADVEKLKEIRLRVQNIVSDNDEDESVLYANISTRIKFENDDETSYISSLKELSKYTYGFNIDLVYGDYLQEELEEEYNLYRLITLKGVQVIGQGQMIQVSGQPIQEVYSFIAKDLI